MSEPEKQPVAYFSAGVFAVALIGGLLLGLAVSWAQGPPPQRNTEPHQLRQGEKQHYSLAIAIAHQFHQDLGKALDELIQLRPGGDPLQALADAACELARDGYATTPGGMNGLRMAAELYQSQGRGGCAEELLPGVDMGYLPRREPVSTLAPVVTLAPSKTPFKGDALPSATPRAIATALPRRSFIALPARTFCDGSRPALIEVFVVDALARGIPGQRIRLRFDDQQDIFLSGMKAERGPAYADFQMREGMGYIIDMPDAADALRATLRTAPCFTESGQESLKSFRITFRETG